MTTDVTSTHDDALSRREAVVFGRYLAGSPPNDAEVDRYVAAVRSGRFEVSDRDRRTLDFVVRHPWLLGFIDGGLALRRPRSGVRVRLLAMAAILEASPDHVDDFLSVRRSPLYAVVVGLVGIRAGFRGAIGAVLVTWI